MTYIVRIIKSKSARLVHTESLARAVLSLIKSSRRNPQYPVDLTVDDVKLLASYSPDSEEPYTWQYDLEQPEWQPYIKHKLCTT